MDLNKTITYGELLSMWHFIELDGHIITNQSYSNTWANQATIPSDKNAGITATFGIYFIYPKTESYINKASTPIISYGNQDAGVARIMIYDTENDKYIHADVTYRNMWNKPLFVPSKIVDVDDVSHTLNMLNYSIRGWIYGKEVIS